MAFLAGSQLWSELDSESESWKIPVGEKTDHGRLFSSVAQFNATQWREQRNIRRALFT